MKARMFRMRASPGSVGLAPLFLLLASFLASRGDDTPPRVIPAAQAKDHIDERCTVGMTVRASKNAAKRRTYFLDSEEDFRDPMNFAVLISYDDAEKFKQAGIDDPAEHYRGKTIRVTGKIIAEDDQVRIHVSAPEQIQPVEASEP
jgi:hypothetical protein